MLTDAYIAGFFDGEGCVNLRRERTTRGWKYAVYLSLSQKKPAILLAIQQQHGGSIFASRNRFGSWYSLRLLGLAADKFAARLLPYLVVKRAELLCMLDLRQIVKARHRGGPGQGYTIEEQKSLEQIITRCRNLKKAV